MGRFMLDYYKVPHIKVKGFKKGSEYQKVPVLDIGDRQYNDSYIMPILLSPILQGRPYTDEEIKFEFQMIHGLQVALRKQNGVKYFFNSGFIIGGCIGCCVSSCSCCMPCITGKIAPEYWDP